MTMAYTISRLSHDQQTKHGCVIVNQDLRILGAGYNGFAKGRNDKEMIAKGYAVRPAKYKRMIHAEVNAVSNCEHRPEGGITFITGKSCSRCFEHLHQNGVVKYYMLDRISTMLVDSDEEVLFREFVEDIKPDYEIIKPDLSFILPMTKELHELGFIHTEREDNIEHLLEGNL